MIQRLGRTLFFAAILTLPMVSPAGAQQVADFSFGSVRIGNNTATCGSLYAGGIRWTGTNLQLCDGTGWSSFAGIGTGSSSWSSLTAPSANLSLGMGAYTTTFTYGAATGVANLFNLSDTTNNTGNGILLDVSTASGSALTPFKVSPQSSDAFAVYPGGQVVVGNISGGYPYTQFETKSGASGTQLAWGQPHYDSSAIEGTLGYDGGSATLNINAANASLSLSTGGGYSTLVLDRNQNISMGGNGFLKIPAGTAAQQPGQSSQPVAADGMIRYNTTTGKFEAHENGAWTNVISGGGGAWSGLTSPTANLSLNMAAYTTIWTAGASTSGNVFTMTDTANNSGNGYLLNLATASGSALNPFHVSAQSTDALTVLANGDVGIGTSAPAHALDVTGDEQLTGSVTFNAASSYQMGYDSSAGGMVIKSVGANNPQPTLSIMPNAVFNGYNTANSTISLISFPSYGTDQVGQIMMTGGPPGLSVNNATSMVLGTIGAYPIGFKTNNTINMVLDNAGHLGIGTTSPYTALDVHGTVKVGDGGETCGSNYAGGIRFTSGAILQYCDGSAWQSIGLASAAGSSGQVEFNNSGAFNADSNFFWDNTDKWLGIDNSAPTVPLSIGPNPVAGFNSGELLQLGRIGDAYMTISDGTGRFLLGSTSGLPFIGTQNNSDFIFRTNNTERVRIDGNGVLYANSGSALTGISLGFGGAGTGEGIGSNRGSGANQDGIDFYTAYANVMSITNSGSVGIGTNNPSYTLQVNGSVAGTSAYNNTSDVRLKKNIREIDNGLDLVERLRGVRFDWRSPGEREIGKSLQLPLATPQVGFIAQEVDEVLPEAVTHGPDGIYTIEESKMTPVLVEAVKQLKAENDGLEHDIADLHAEKKETQATLTAMQSQINGMKAYTGYGVKKAGFDGPFILVMALGFAGITGGLVFVGIELRRRSKEK